MGVTTQTFDVITRIAVGNGSLVYRAVEKTTLRQVALKLLTKDDDLDHGYDVTALLEAAPRLRLITGSHVCQLLDAMDDDDGPVLAYEYANGLSGAEFPHQRKLDVSQAIDVAAQLVSALRSGERQRTPHGDMKPSNVVFVDTPENRPYTFVLDWGLAAFRGAVPKDSRPYLAPERLSGGPISHQADLFSAGAVIFYLLTGKVLALGETNDELLAAWSRARPEVLADLRPDLPAKFVQWLSWLLAVDPQKRPGTAVDAATALGLLNPPPPMIPPETIRPRPLSASQRATANATASGVFSVAGSRIASPPTSGVARAVPSGARPAPSTSSEPPASRPDKAKTLSATPSKSKTAMLAVTLSVAAAIAGTGAWWITRKGRDDASLASASPAPVTAVSIPEPKKKEPSRPKQSGGASNTTTAKKSSDSPVKRIAAEPSAPKVSPPGATAAVATAMTPALAPKSPPKPPAPKPAAAASAPAKPPSLPQKPPASADEQPSIVESFAYEDAAAAEGLSKGTNWAGAWAGQGAKISKTSLQYPGHAAEGGSLVLASGNEIANARRDAGPAARLISDPKKEGHWYFSMLLTHSDRSPTPGGELAIYPFDANASAQGFHIAVADVGSQLRVAMSGAAPLTIPQSNNPVLLVCRVDLANPKAGKWDLTASLMVNPSLEHKAFKDTGKPARAQIKGFALPSQSGVAIVKGPGAAETVVDEIRIVPHWVDVAFKPKPAPAKPKVAGAPQP